MVKRALGNHLAAVDTGARSHVNHMVGCPHHVFVVLNHQHAVANITQVFEGANESVVVPLVQPNAGLVQNIHHACQTRTNLARQSNPLRLAAAERFCAAVQA